MKITICGSITAIDEMKKAVSELESLGYEVETPNFAEAKLHVKLEKDVVKKRGFIDDHFRKIDTSDAILVVNHEKNGVPNYIGGNTLMEMTYAYSHGLEIFLLNQIPELNFIDEIRGMQPIILDGDIKKVDEYFSSLPLVYMSTQSPVKHLALSRGMRRAGIKVQVTGEKIESGVNEQPLSIDETYEGAINRHGALVAAVPERAQYLATIESGQHTLHKDHNSFGCSVIVLEKVGGEQKIHIDFDIEFPRSMTDKVPSQYPDLGVLVQKEYGATLKDPFPYITDGKLTRAKVLESAVYTTAVQLGVVV